MIKIIILLIVVNMSIFCQYKISDNNRNIESKRDTISIIDQIALTQIINNSISKKNCMIFFSDSTNKILLADTNKTNWEYLIYLQSKHFVLTDLSFNNFKELLLDTNIINKDLNKVSSIKKELYFRVWHNHKLIECYVNLDLNYEKFYELLKDALQNMEYGMIKKFIDESSK